MNEMENKNKTETMNKAKCWFYEKITMNFL